MSQLSLEKAKEYLVRRVSADERYEDLLNFPRYIEIETVNACNARCPMCTIADWQRHTPTMKDDLFKRIADEIIEHRDVVKRVGLFRDGEPLLDKKLPDRVAMLTDGGVKLTSICTNVSLLTEAKSRALLEAGLGTIILSIDSLEKEVFESIRVRLKLEEVLENAHKFIELRDKIRPETQIYMRMIRQESNYEEWPAYEAYWRPKLAPHDKLYYHYIFNWGGQLDGFKPVAATREVNLPCVSLWSLLVIFGDGRVPLCNVDYNDKFPTGSVLEHSIAELWQSKIMNERRELHLGGEKGQISICENCNVWDDGHVEEGAISSEYSEELALVG